jgi:simple sugar transport system ATP-binding protein
MSEDPASHQADDTAVTAAEPGSVAVAAPEPLLELRGITKVYGRAKALDDVSFYVGKGEILGLLGDNGAGKSTLVKTMSGVVLPDEGTMLWDGKPVQLHNRHDSTSLGIEVI